MAGEWIKIEVATANKPEVMRIARILGIDKDAVFGKVMRLWAWFDTNSVDGVVDGIQSTDVDDVCYQVGFCNALLSVGWIQVDESTPRISLPKFDRHNGESAKKRCQKSEAQAKWRKSRSNVDQEASTKEPQQRLPEKRREEKINTYVNQAEAVIDLYHSALPELPTVKLVTDKRKKAIGGFVKFVMTSKKSDGTPRATNEAEALEWINAYFLRVRDNNFLMGKIGRVGEHAGWQCDLDYLLTEKGMTQVIEKTREAA